MKILMSVCPHDAAKGVDRWKHFAKELEDRTGRKVELITFESFEEEARVLDSQTIHIHYANPFAQIKLLNSGYIPLAKFKNQKDEFFLISKEDYQDKELIKLAIPSFNFSGLAFLYLMVENLSVVLVKDFFEVFEHVKNGLADIGIMYGENWHQIEDKQGIKKISDTVFETSHLFMVHQSVDGNIKQHLLSLDGIEPASTHDIDRSRKFVEYSKNFSDIWKIKSIYKSVEGSPFIGFMIYQDKIVYANDYFCKLTGYSLEELKNTDTVDIVRRIKDEDIRNKVFKVVEQRLHGNFGLRTYSKLGFYTKSMEVIYVDMYGDTILYNGKPSGLVFIVDRTKEVKLEKLSSFIREINQILVSLNSEREILSKITHTLVDKFGLKLVWVGEEDRKTKTIKPIFWAGEASDYLEGLVVSSLETVPEGRGPTGRAYREDIIVVNPDSNKAEMMEPWRDRLLKHGLLSSVAIPIKKNKTVRYVLSIYSDEKNFFTDEFIDVLKELKEDIEFSLAKVEQLKKMITISEAIKNSKSWILITDRYEKIIYISNHVCELSGYSCKELIGSTPGIFRSGYHDEEFYRKLKHSLMAEEPFDAVFVNRRKDGSVFYLEQTIFPVKLPDGEVRYMSVGRDITKERLMTTELNRYKFYDPVTDLYNFYGFMFKINEDIKDNNTGVLILIDIVNFTNINKIYGFEFGDKVLKSIATKLKSLFRNKDLIARVGNDEFGIFTPISDKKYITIIYEKVFFSFSDRVNIDGVDILISLNAGISVYPEDGRTFEELYRNCSVALREAKSEGAGVFKFYNKEIETRIQIIQTAEILVSKAFEKRLFKFYYQPYFHTADLSLAGFEALIRIVDEDGKVYAPGYFIDYLENSSLIFEFEDWALKEAAQKSAKWKTNISINISARNFSDMNFIKKFIDVINSNQDVMLTYEITERVFIRNQKTVKEFLDMLKEHRRVKVAIDDFGTGYSSLTYLKEMPANILKIDMSFTKNMVSNNIDRAITKTIISFASDIGMESLAEGVETWQQYEMLKAMGCTYVQGFLFGKPMPEEEIEKLYNLT